MSGKMVKQGSGPKKVPTNVKKYVKEQLNETVEHKYFLASDSATTVDFGGAVYDKTPVPQGDTDVTRDGDKIKLEEISFRYTVQIADTTNVFRVILFQWHPSSSPGITNILLTVGSANGVNSALTVDYEQQYKILYDRTHYLNNVAVPQTGLTEAVVIKKGFQKQMQFIAGGTTGTNHIWAAFISDSAAATHPSINSSMRIRFSDA